MAVEKRNVLHHDAKALVLREESERPFGCSEETPAAAAAAGDDDDAEGGEKRSER